MTHARMQIGETRFSVDYNFLENGTPYYIKNDFMTREEAEEWARKNTTDGKVQSYTRIS